MTRTVSLRAAFLALVLMLVVAVPAALAGKGAPGKGGSSSNSTVALVVLDGPDALANHRERITFEVSTTATDRPFVGVRCWQGSNWVLDAYVGFFPTYMFDPWVTLNSDYWAAGVDAVCTARLFYYDKRGNQNVLTTLDFPVGL